VHLEGKGHSDYRRRSGDRGAMARLFASEGATVANGGQRQESSPRGSTITLGAEEVEELRFSLFEPNA
jgi:hypothetical protein